MTKIALTAAALLIAVSTAFAGSDKFGSNNTSQPAVTNTDNTIVTSIEKPDAVTQMPIAQGSNRNLFGNR
ncbi:MAG: DUF680 domain-containing protein [Mesorhizobium sp.]|nr:MAG: DUF680 domain-containing protein [Mesorhizobium sp.]